MTGIVIVIALFTVAIGLVSLASPRHIARLTNRLDTPFGLYISGGIKVLLGVSLWFAAPTSRNPDVLQALGALFVVGGLLRPILGPKVIRPMLDWWVSRPGLVRTWGCMAMVFGVLLIYWVSP